MFIMTKIAKCKLLDSLYAHINNTFKYENLMLHNENQIDTLLSACKDEEGNLRKTTNEDK